MNQVPTPSFEALREIPGYWRSDGEFIPARITQIGAAGAHIKTAFPEKVSAVVEVRLEVLGREIFAEGVVNRVYAGSGMSIEFKSLTAENKAFLDRLAEQIELARALWVSRSSWANRQTGSGPIQTKAPNSRVPRNRRVERRERMRHKFSATVALAGPEGEKPVKAQLTELGRGGCFVKIAEPFPVGSILRVSITENNQTVRARAIVASVQPGEGMGLGFSALEPLDNLLLEEWLENCVERHWLAANRRKSQRVVVNLPVRVIAKNSAGTEISEDTTTVSVSPHGALLELEMKVRKGQKVVLQNPDTGDALECSIDYLGGSHDGRREIGVSFLLHNRTLWQISFPVEFAPQHTCTKTDD